MTKTLIVAVAVLGTFTATAMTTASPAIAAPYGFGNAQDTVNSLQSQGFNVILNGASVFPLSSCKVTGVEGLNSSNVDSSGRRIDPTQFDTVYVDISCRGG
jgi:hypothetical protein